MGPVEFPDPPALSTVWYVLEDIDFERLDGKPLWRANEADQPGWQAIAG